MKIGKNIETNENVEIDLQRLISTRLLIQANSGGGKSWLIRRLLEQTHGKVQQIVIDLEGEFSTLREKFDYLLVGKDGEIPANIQTAELLAKKLLKLNVSTIIDLSELKHHERITFVKRFLDSLVNAPRELWHSCLVIVDEAHQFCPEGKMSESGESVIDLCTRGRKRGFCAVIATQRIAKLHKDAAAECTNGLVGRTVLDIDRKRAANDLGFTTKEQELSLKKMGDGVFFGYGPAISKDDYVKIKVGDIKTTHPEPGKNIIKASKTPDNIKKLLKDVIDLPKEAEEELKTKKDFLNKINELKRELRSKPKPMADEKALDKAFNHGAIESQRKQGNILKEIESNYKKLERDFKNYMRKDNLTLDLFKKELQQIIAKCSKLLQIEHPKMIFNELTKFNPIPIQSKPKIQKTVGEIPAATTPRPPVEIPISDELDTNEIVLGICAKKIYSVLYGNQDKEFTKVQLGLLSGYSPKSGGFGNALAQMNVMNLIKRDNGMISINEINEEYATEEIEGTSQELWSKKLGLCSRKIFEFLLENGYEEFSKDQIADMVGYSVSSGGFGNALAQLNSLGFIKRNNNKIKINQEILEL